MTTLAMPVDDRTTESELVEAARRRDVSAVGELYRRHADAVFTLACRMLGSRAEAEDVLQDVFVGLPRALESYRETGRFEGWLRRVTARTALMRLRSARRKREAPLIEARTAEVASDSTIDRIELERALARLPDPLRTVFVLREIEGHSHAEIGALLDISAAVSAMRLSRAWAALRKETRA